MLITHLLIGTVLTIVKNCNINEHNTATWLLWPQGMEGRRMKKVSFLFLGYRPSWVQFWNRKCLSLAFCHLIHTCTSQSWTSATRSQPSALYTQLWFSTQMCLSWLPRVSSSKYTYLTFPPHTRTQCPSLRIPAASNVKKKAILLFTHITFQDKTLPEALTVLRGTNS